MLIDFIIVHLVLSTDPPSLSTNCKAHFIRPMASSASHHMNVQEIILYCGSRLRAATVATVQERYDTIQSWKLCFIVVELVR